MEVLERCRACGIEMKQVLSRTFRRVDFRRLERESSKARAVVSP